MGDDRNDRRARFNEYVNRLKAQSKDAIQGTELVKDIIRQAGFRRLSPLAMFVATTQMCAMIEAFTEFSSGSLLDETNRNLDTDALMTLLAMHWKNAGLEIQEPCEHCGYFHEPNDDETQEATIPQSAAPDPTKN